MQSAMSPPTSVSPEATFIAASAASQIVTNDHDSHADTWYDQHGFQPSGDPVLVSATALQLLNNFLDHLLFNFLAQSGSTKLPTLRPAVTEVLKPKLAKDAINNADEELREYLGGGDDEEFLQSHPAPSPRDWDLELVWKRTRLRCMVYSSLGDMEEEDEDHHVEEGLLSDDDEDLGGSVSPAVAIFLTSILEFLGEQALISASRAAWNRLRVKYEKEQKDGVKGRSDVVDRMVVEEVDMERVALDRTLGRLWRAWRKRIRSPGPNAVDPAQHPLSREKVPQFRRGSAAAESAVPPAVQEHITEHVTAENSSVAQEEKATAEPGDVPAAAIPLPMSERDIDEIEVPGLTHYSDNETEVEESEELDRDTRSKSLMVLPLTSKADLPTPTMSRPQTPTTAQRKRSNSLPTPIASPNARSKTTAVVVDATRIPQATDQPLSKQQVNEKVVAPKAADVQTESGHVASDEEKPPIGEKSARRQSGGLIPRIVGAAATGVGAGPGTAPAKNDTEHKHDAYADDSDYEVEEAQILTSSRVSVGTSISNRSISPATSDRSSRPALSIQTLPVRSGSLRLVDVASPRTPSTRSQKSWIQEQSSSSYSRSGDVSRASSVRTQSNLEEPRAAEETRAVPGPSSLGKSRNSVIPEGEEHAEPTLRQASLTSAPAAAVVSRKESPKMLDIQATTGERRPEPQKAHSYHQSQRQQSSETKVAVFNTSPDSDTFSEDELAPLPQRHPRRTPRHFAPQAGTPSPPIPEETASSYIHEPSQSGSSQPGTIGIVSVDRSGIPRDPPNPPQDHSTNRQRSGSSPTSSHKVRAARGSQDSTATRPGDVIRNFDDLIQSNETIQYTLTPDNVREIESTVSSKSRNRAGSSATNKTVELMRSASLSRSSPLQSNPVGMHWGEHTPESSPRGPPVSTSNRARGAMPQARDARVPRESMVEFAEFIRATGPPGADAGPPVPLKRNLSLMNKRTAPSPAPSSKMSADYGRPSMSSSIGRARLQARDATVDTSNDKSDLIDFIRRGPPSSGNPHIPRTVAPFRTTMDSDQLASAVGGKAMDATLPDIHDTRYSQASTNVTDLSATSVQSSINSQSALLGRKQVAGQTSAPFEEEDMMPQRKQRRVRDPYAIDFSDEEEEDDDFEPQPRAKAQQPKEESFLDFLNSEPPPPPSAPVPFNIPRTQSSHEQMQVPKKKASAPSLIARFRQNSSSGISGGAKSPTSPARSQKMYESRSLSSRAGSGTTSASKGYVPIQVNIPAGGDMYPSYGSTTTVPPVPKMPPTMTASRPSGRVPMKKFEPREAVSVPSRGTSDLADFLRDSSPPPSLGPSYPASPVETNSGSKFFGRRKKSTVFA
ncbi:hypothetical protein VMCG_07646 [Cytospora schulzeri]|uniref:Uncharacterized protein n=1 Tax=Cytospora schulzeri TaxID=448051 RepID=A0A423VZ71_9PEZI|nr:hypothetical protein VMCG_07646 [Valsa malicola]